MRSLASFKSMTSKSLAPVLFNSLTFIAFFVVVLVLHNAPLPWKVKKVNLLLASYVFYAAWNPPFVILLWISTVIDWHVAKRLFVEQAKNRRRALLAVSVVVNLGLLGYFKYGEFLLENFIALAAMVGEPFEPFDPDELRTRAAAWADRLRPFVARADAIIPLACIVGAPACDARPFEARPRPPGRRRLRRPPGSQPPRSTAR